MKMLTVAGWSRVLIFHPLEKDCTSPLFALWVGVTSPPINVSVAIWLILPNKMLKKCSEALNVLV